MGLGARDIAERHIEALKDILGLTAENSPEAAAATMLVVTKMISVLAGRETGEQAGEAKGEAYMAALEDVAFWAVEEGQRRWYRGEYGDSHDYKWMPDPATLRQLARQEEFLAKNTISKLQSILDAEPLNEKCEDEMRSMRDKLAKLGIGMQHV